MLRAPSLPQKSCSAVESAKVNGRSFVFLLFGTNTFRLLTNQLQPLRFLIRLCSERGLVLPEGTLISSGAVTGIHDVVVSSKAHVDFGNFGAFNVAFEAKQASQ